MRIRSGRSMLAVAALAIFGALPVATAQGVPDDPIEFEPSERVTLNGADGTVDLTSNLPADAPVRLRLRFPTPLVDSDGDTVPVKSRVFVPRRITLPAEQTVTIPILVGDLSDIEEGTSVDGRLRAITEVNGTAVETSVKLRLEVPAADQPDPLVTDVTAWTVVRTDYRDRDTYAGEVLPVTADADSPVPTRLGVLQDGSGNTLTVTGTLVENDGESAAGLKLSFEGFESGTTYTGSIDLDPESDEGEVELTVRSTDPVRWAILVLIAGICAGLLAAWLAAIYWPLRRLRKDAESATAQVGDFTQPTARPPGVDGTWELGSDAESVDGEVEAAVSKLRRTSFGKLDRSRPEYVEASQRMAELEAGIVAWNDKARSTVDGLPAKVAALDVPRADLVPPPGAAAKPAIIAAAIAHVTPRAVAVGELPSFVTTSSWMSATVADFADLWGTARERRRFLAEVAASTAAPWKLRSMAQDALLELDAGRWHLWHATSKDDLEAGNVNDRFKAVDDVVAKLRSIDGIAAPQANVRQDRIAANANAFSGDLSLLLPAPIVSGVAALAKPVTAGLKGLISAGQGALVLAIVVIGIVIGVRTGLGELYDGKGFGTFNDYLGAFVWGFAAATVIGAVTGTLDAFFGRRLAAEEEATDG